jgi:hypothetical protein
MSTMNPWLRLLLCVTVWAFATVFISFLVARANEAFQVSAVVALFIVWPALIFWFRVPRSGSVKGQIGRLVLYLTVMTPVGIAAFVLGALISIHVFGLF